MLEAVFSFRGRINRVRYFLANLALGMAIVTLAVVAIISLGGLAHAARPTAALLPVGLLLLVAAPVSMWISFSLQARRFRDIGWDPVLMIPGWLGVMFIDALVARGVPALSLGLVHQTLFGVLANLAMLCILWFWPGRGDDGPSDAIWSERPAPQPQRRPQTQTPVMPASAPRAAAGAPRFGQRGL